MPYPFNAGLCLLQPIFLLFSKKNMKTHAYLRNLFSSPIPYPPLPWSCGYWLLLGLATPYPSEGTKQYSMWFNQRHILREKRPSTAACPACGGDEDRGIEILYGEEKNIFTEPIRAANAEKKSLVPAWQTKRSNQGNNSFHLYSFSPHSPEFLQSAGATHVYSIVFVSLGLTS